MTDSTTTVAKPLPVLDSAPKKPENRGGVRAGAGRPPKALTKSDIQKAQALANKFKTYTVKGLDTLAQKMPDLIDAALEEALSNVDEAGNPKKRDTNMLKFLIQLGVDFVDMDEIGKKRDGVEGILAGARNNPVNLTQENHYHYGNNLPGDSSADSEDAEEEATL